MSPIWMSTSNFYSAEEIDMNSKSMIAESMEAEEDETTNKSMSKMRSYLKRCENAINRINLSGKRIANSLSTSTSAPSSLKESSSSSRARKSTSSWYIDEIQCESRDQCHNEVNFMEIESNNATNKQHMHFTSGEQIINTKNESVNDRMPHFKCAPTLQMVSSNSILTLVINA